MIKFQLQKAISKVLEKITGLKVKPEDVHLEHPGREEHGDYATNIALEIFSKLKIQNENLRPELRSSTPRPFRLEESRECKITISTFAKATADKQNSKLTKYKTPLDLARAIQEQLSLNFSISQFLNFCRIAAPGFINISIKTEWFINELKRVLEDSDAYGKSKVGKGKTIMVEYAHPNTHKLFHIGHLRNITNGEAMVRILEASGYRVIRANYQGDVGMHIAKSLWAILQKFKIQNEKCKIMPAKPSMLGKTGTIENLKLKSLDDKIKFLGDCYVEGNRFYEKDKDAKKEILEINKKIYDQTDPEINKLWEETRQWSLDYFERIYKRVYSHFDRYYFESEVAKKGKQIVLQALKKGIFTKSKGAVIFAGSKYGLHDRVFITGEGNPTYEAKDMELGRLQFEEYSPNLIIHNVGPEQREYFKVIFEALAQIYPETRGKEYHLMYGWVRLKKGKMSSRLGNVVTGEWLLDEAKRRIKKISQIDPRSWIKKAKKKKDKKDKVEETAEIVAVGAVKYSFLKVSPPQDLAFDFDESINLQGNSGPYLQYTYARCQSVLAKGKRSTLPRRVDPSSSKRVDINPEELNLLRTFYKFPEVVLAAGEQYAPNLICNFLYDLAQKYNTFYNKHRILKFKNKNAKFKIEMQNSKFEKSKTEFRLILTAATAQILKTGLYLLGIKAPRKM